MIAQNPFAPCQVSGTPSSLSGSGCFQDLFEHGFGGFGIFFAKNSQFFINQVFNKTLHVTVSQLGFGLPFKLGLGQLDTHNAGQALPNVITRQFVEITFGHLVLNRILLDGAGEARFEARQVCSTFPGVDVVGEGQDFFIVGLVVLDRYFNLYVLTLPLEVNDFRMDRLFIFVQVIHKGYKSAFVAVTSFFDDLVIHQVNADSGVKEGQFPKTLCQNVETHFRVGEDAGIGLEGNASPPFLGFSFDGQRGYRFSAFVTLMVDFPILANFDIEPFAQSIDHGYSHTMESTGNLVCTGIELAPCVQLGHDYLDGGNVFLFVEIHGDAASVVVHSDRVVLVYMNADMVAVACQSLVDTVVHHFVNEMMKPLGRDIADVHGRTFSYGTEPLQNRDPLSSVLVYGIAHINDRCFRHLTNL